MFTLYQVNLDKVDVSQLDRSSLDRGDGASTPSTCATPLMSRNSESIGDSAANR